MKRSEINRRIRAALQFFDDRRFLLPPFAHWTPEEWKSKGAEADEIRRNRLGWDLTDFGSGRFDDMGLLLFTIRNGRPDAPGGKPYAEKIMIVGAGQVTPLHFHWSKMEDIIVRGGGNLNIQLYDSTSDEDLSEAPFHTSLDGMLRSFQPGDVVTLRPGESITLHQRLYHKFWGEPGKGQVLVGEVSSVNDDATDNRFHEPVGRFPSIEEDEPPFRLLCTEYPASG